MAFCRAGFAAGASLSRFFFSPITNQSNDSDYSWQECSWEMDSLGSRAAVLRQPLCKFLFADHSGVEWR